MIRIRCSYVLLVALLTLSLSAPAQDDAAAPAEEKPPAAPEAEAKPEPKPKPKKELRDPFWPVGHVRIDKSKVEEKIVLKGNPEIWPKLIVKGISKTPKGHIAFLKGIGMVSEGEVLRLKRGRRIYSIEITSVSKLGIKTRRIKSVVVDEKESGKTPATGGAKAPAKAAQMNAR